MVYSLSLCVPKCTHSQCKKSVSEFFDHTLYIDYVKQKQSSVNSGQIINIRVIYI